jgi:hypothetical protein
LFPLQWFSDSSLLWFIECCDCVLFVWSSELQLLWFILHSDCVRSDGSAIRRSCGLGCVAIVFAFVV